MKLKQLEYLLLRHEAGEVRTVFEHPISLVLNAFVRRL